MTYQEILKSVGYPEEVLIIDFETYFDSDYNLSKMSTIEYICDPRFEFTGLGVAAEPEFEPQFLIPNEIRSYCDSVDWGIVTVVAKNCKFDITILTVKFGIIPPFIIDIDDLLRHYDARMSHKMKDVAPMFGLQPKGDTNQFKGLHYEEMDKDTKSNLRAYSTTDVEIETALFKILLPKITNPTVELPVARHTLDLYLRPCIQFDMPGAYLLAGQMQEELQKIIEVTGHDKKELSGSLSFVEFLQNTLPEGEVIPVKAGKPGKNMTKLLGSPGVIPAFAKDDTGFQELLVHPDLNVRNLCVARQAVKSWPLHIKRIFNMANQARTCGGLLRILLNYYAAHTGRWGGGGGINPQNLGGRGRGGQGTHPLIAAMRNLLCAPDGSILGIADSAQIEARILGWFADQADLIQDFATGKSPYCTLATEIFKTKIWKPSDKEKETPEGKIIAIKYGFGKDGILGLGYGMGTNKFYSNCIVNPDLRPFFNSGEYGWDFINRLVKTYRTMYKKIPQFWQDVEKAFKWVIKYPHETAQVSRTYDEDGNAAGMRLMFFNDKGTVHIRLPSGRELTYRHCALKHTTKGSQIRWHWGHLWGGSITENIVQAVARDLLAYWILEMDKAGLNIVLHSHDEIICMFIKKDPFLQVMLNIMRHGPDWATGLPLDAEGVLTDVYTK